MIFGVKTVLRLFKRKLLETNLNIILCSEHDLNKTVSTASDDFQNFKSFEMLFIVLQNMRHIALC